MIMCKATRFPEAVSVCNIKALKIVDSLVHFCGYSIISAIRSGIQFYVWSHAASNVSAWYQAV